MPPPGRSDPSAQATLSRPPAPGAHPPSDPPESEAADTFSRFQSRTGNTACEIGEDVVVRGFCEVRQNSYKSQVQPDCQPGSVTGFFLHEGRAVTANCFPDSGFPGVLPVQVMDNR